MTKILLNRDDFLKMSQDYINEQFNDLVIRGITFVDTQGKQIGISKVEIDYFRECKK